jgi:hypothetical protein
VNQLGAERHVAESDEFSVVGGRVAVPHLEHRREVFVGELTASAE